MATLGSQSIILVRSSDSKSVLIMGSVKGINIEFSQDG